MTKTAASAASRGTLRTDLGLPVGGQAVSATPVLPTTRVRKSHHGVVEECEVTHGPCQAVFAVSGGSAHLFLPARQLVILGRGFCLRGGKLRRYVASFALSRARPPNAPPGAAIWHPTGRLFSPIARISSRAAAGDGITSMRVNWNESAARHATAGTCKPRAMPGAGWRSPCTGAHLVRAPKRRASEYSRHAAKTRNGERSVHS